MSVAKKVVWHTSVLFTGTMRTIYVTGPVKRDQVVSGHKLHLIINSKYLGFCTIDLISVNCKMLLIKLSIYGRKFIVIAQIGH